MKILIPMAGKSKRFQDFLEPKPLIEIDGKPMIEHVVSQFPHDSNFIFVCYDKHLKETNMEEVLERIAPDSEIISVSEEMLNGPAYSSLAAFDKIEDSEEVIINYCDFIQIWDFKHFYDKIKEKKPDGAIVSFKGFHPSSLVGTKYAYMKTQGDYISELREKESFSENSMEDYASTGTYYFSSGKLFKRYVKEITSNKNYAVKGEFYSSLPYILMMRDNLKILNYEVKKFICLGTPRDYEMYKFWSEFFLKYSPNFVTFNNMNLKVKNIFPIAGGERKFKGLGYNLPSYTMPIMNKTLIDYAYASNPRGQKNIFLGLKAEKDYIENLNPVKLPNSEVIYLEEIKKGNAATLFTLRDKIKNSSVAICGSTYILDYNVEKLSHLFEKTDIDIILLSFSHHESILRDPNSFAYAKLKNNIEVSEIIEKRAVSDKPYKDKALTGTAIFRNSQDLFEAIELEMDKNNQESFYYLKSLNNILSKKKVVIFDVDKFVPIRNVSDYLEFSYWQDYFDGQSYHPYFKRYQ